MTSTVPAKTPRRRTEFVQAFRLGGVELEIRSTEMLMDGPFLFRVRNISVGQREHDFRLDHLGSLAKLVDIVLWWYYQQEADAGC